MQLTSLRGLVKPVETPRSARQAPRAVQSLKWQHTSKAVPDQATADADVQGFEEARPHELVRVLAQLESDLEAASAQLGTVKASDTTEQAALEAVQTELSSVKTTLEADQAAQKAEDDARSGAWSRSMRLAQQALEMKRLIAERDAEVIDLQRQLAEFETTEAPLPVLAYAGGGHDDEGRERVATLERQLQLQLQGRMEPLPATRPAALPLVRPEQAHKTIEDLLRSAAFPGMLLFATAGVATKACSTVWKVVTRRR